MVKYPKHTEMEVHLSTKKGITNADIVYCILFALALFLWGWQVNKDIDWMQARGIPASGIVTAVTPLFRTQITVSVQYQTTEGASELASLSWYESARQGDRVEILYSPYDHQAIMLKSTQGNYVLYLISGILFVFGALGALARFLDKKA